jgi:uncharacterized protein YprB with RNaseH-like and TPR domain
MNNTTEMLHITLNRHQRKSLEEALQRGDLKGFVRSLGIDPDRHFNATSGRKNVLTYHGYPLPDAPSTNS